MAGKATDGVQPANDEVGGVAILQHYNHQVVIIVLALQIGPIHLLVQDHTGESKKAGARVFK